MKKIKEGIKKFISTIKELRKTEKGKAILFFGFYFFFFLFIAIVARINPRYSNPVDVNNNKFNNNLSFSLIEQANYNFNYSVNVDGVIYNYIGNKNNSDELFTVNSVNYYKNGDNYYTNASGIWLKTENPYVFEDFLKIDRINDIFGDATFVSKAKYETGEVTYSYKILSASIVNKLEGINIDIEEVPNEIIFSTNSSGDVNKIQIVLNSYGKYKKVCNNTFTITLNYSVFGKVSEIVNPID